MGPSVLSMLLLLTGSVRHWCKKEIEAEKPGDTCGAGLHIGGRILGGRNATEREFPWMVALQNTSGSQHCGGSIIEPDIVVTAAHCLEGKVPADVVVQAGILDLNNQPWYSQLRHVRKFAVHESFVHELNGREKFFNDIALLKLVDPFDFGKSHGRIGAICLPAKDRPVKNKVEVTGWGTTSHGGPKSSRLLAVSVPVLSSKTCASETEITYDSKMMFCAGSPGKDSCTHDSGGPAVQKESQSSILVGVVSFGYHCAKAPAYGVYTRVPAYTAWIAEKIVKLQTVVTTDYLSKKSNTYSLRRC